MAVIINGKELSIKIKHELSKEVKLLKSKNVVPGLAVVLVGNDEASKIYVRNKQKSCSEVGIYSEKYELPENTSEEQILNLVEDLNKKENIDGVLVQLPLPKHIDEDKIIDLISPFKDVDAFHPFNVGKIMIGKNGFVPCTPEGIMEILSSQDISITGKNCVVVGSSNIVGKPMAMLLINQNATVTVCNKYTKNLKEHCKNADILIVAVGKAKLITADMVKTGAVVIDVGINRDENGKLCGDVDFEEVEKIASYITPVPGGVGPMTIAMLLKNTIYSAKHYRKN